MADRIFLPFAMKEYQEYLAEERQHLLVFACCFPLASLLVIVGGLALIYCEVVTTFLAIGGVIVVCGLISLILLACGVFFWRSRARIVGFSWSGIMIDDDKIMLVDLDGKPIDNGELLEKGLYEWRTSQWDLSLRYHKSRYKIPERYFAKPEEAWATLAGLVDSD